MDPFDQGTLPARGRTAPALGTPRTVGPIGPTLPLAERPRSWSLAASQHTEVGLALLRTCPAPLGIAGQGSSLIDLPTSGPILATIHAVSLLLPPGGASWGLLTQLAKELPPELFPGPYQDLRDRHPEAPDIRTGLQDWVGNRARLERAVGKSRSSRQPDDRRKELDAWMREKQSRVYLVLLAAAEAGLHIGADDKQQRLAEIARKAAWAGSDAGRQFADQCAEAVYNASTQGRDAEAGVAKAIIAGVEIMWMLHDFSLCNHTVEEMTKFAAGLRAVYPHPS